MPSWYVHMQAAAQTMESLKAGVPAGSPLSQAEADALFEAAHTHRNYLAAGALGPDLFFLLPDFKGDVGKGLLNLVDFVLNTWQVYDDNVGTQWERWMAPVLDEAHQIADHLSLGMLGEASMALDLTISGIENVTLGIAAQLEDVFGQMTSGTQTGYADSGFFWSDMFHYRKTYQFARRLYANALRADEDLPAGEPSRVPKQQAFALGWMSHCAADVAAHPFTNAKCGGPYRTHWQRHHVIENHMDAFVYGTTPGRPGPNYGAIDVAALHFRMAFLKSKTSPDPTMPDDEAGPDWFPGPAGQFDFPPYVETDGDNDAARRRERFDVDSEPLPEHLCDLLLRTMQDVYTGPADRYGPRVLAWDPGRNEGDGGRPSVPVLQNMYQFAYDYAKFTSSSGLTARHPMAPEAVTDFDFPRLPGLPADGDADPLRPQDITILDILLAVIAIALWLLEVAVWFVVAGPALLGELANWPARQLLYETVVAPAWDFYLASRKALVLEGYILPKPEEISAGLTVLGQDEIGPLIQLRADLDAPNGVGLPAGATEPSGLDPRPGASPSGYGLDPAYPRALLTDLQPPWLAQAPVDGGSVPSEFVAPWRYPEHNQAGMRNGWEAPRTHVGPYLQGARPDVLMGGMQGSDAARHRYEAARTPEETETASSELLATPGRHLGDPIDYGAYLIGHLTGSWLSDTEYVANDADAPLPDFNLDADRGYAYQCWDYLRHAPSVPPSPRSDLDRTWPDQWQCAPQVASLLSTLAGGDPHQLTERIRDWYGYAEPLTVPARYDGADNPHHRTRHDPLKRLAHTYPPRPGEPPPPAPVNLDLQVSVAEMREAGMSTTGRKPV